MLHQETVETGTLALIKKLSSDPKLKDFVLVGGTALALRLGHRRSVDIDLFSAFNFDPFAIASHVDTIYHAKETTVVGKGAVYTLLEGIKTDFLSHNYPWIKLPENIEDIRMASLEDIGAMKIHAIVNSGTRLKDYIDVYHLLELNGLEQIIAGYLNKYPEANASVAKNALIYHNEIDFLKAIDLTNPDLALKDVTKRLREAVAEPKRIFQPKQTLDSDNKTNQTVKLNKSLKKRKRL